MGKITIIEGDLLKAPEFHKVHQVNCKGVMGRGLAKQVKEQFPNVFKGYKYLCDQHIDHTYCLLGQTQFIHVPDGVIINLFGEDGYGDPSKRHTNYEAFYVALKEIYIKITDKDLPREVAFPYKIGSALGGADWNVILAMIRSVFEPTDINVTIYKYEPNS